MIIGIIGLILLAIGWLSEIVKIIREKRSKLDLKFAILYTVGSLCLVAYSIQINNNHIHNFKFCSSDYEFDFFGLYN